MKVRKSLKRILLTTICTSFLFSSVFTPNSIHASEAMDVSDVPVYTINDDGEIIPSDMDPNVLYGMLHENSNNELLRQVPGPDGNAVRLGNVEYNVLHSARDIYNVIKVLGSMLWVSYGGVLFDLVKSTVISQLGFGSLISFVADDFIISIAQSFIPNSYTSSYMYKSWSTYYNKYLVYACVAVYSDSGRTNLLKFYHKQLADGSAKLAIL